MKPGTEADPICAMATSAASLTAPLRFLAKYHVAATRQTVECIPAQLADRETSCLFFGTIHATINHIAGVDKLWRLRLSGQSSVAFEAFDRFYRNDPQSGVTRAELWRTYEPDWARSTVLAVDAAEATEAFVLAQTEESLLEHVAYQRTDGTEVKIQRGAALMHLLNHATHHRGQIHAALTEAGCRDLVLDMPALLGVEECHF